MSTHSRRQAYETDPTPYLAFMAIAGGLFLSALALLGGIAIAGPARRARSAFLGLALAGVGWVVLRWDRIALEMHRAQRAGERHRMFVHFHESLGAA